MAYTKKEFNGPSFSSKELSERWDRAVSHSEHFKQTEPTITDIHYKKVVWNLLKRLVPKPAGKKILKLDLYNEATGTTHAGYFVQNSAKIYGIDISFKINHQAKLKCGHQILGSQGDVRNLPFKSESFDVIFSLGTLEHVQDADQPITIKELFRVLKPGGICILGVNNRYSLWLTPLLFEFLEWTGLIREQWSYEPTYPPSHLKWLYRQQGFEKIRNDGTLLFPKWFRVYDMWSASRRGPIFNLMNRIKNLLYQPLVWGIEKLENFRILNYFADQTLTIGIKPAKVNHAVK